MNQKMKSGAMVLVIAVFGVVGLGALSLSSNANAEDPPAPHPRKTVHERKKKTRKPKAEKAPEPSKMPALSFMMKDINGKEQDLRQYEGNVVLLVNVASKCGLTPHYEGIEALYEKYKDRGFVVLGFPANNFGAQEPGTDREIKAFCSAKYNVKFPMFSKVSVKGDDICPLYKYLTNEKADHKFGGEIEWNFCKIIVNRKGEVIGRFHPRTAPDDKALVAAIESQLDETVPENSALGRKQKADAEKQEGTKEETTKEHGDSSSKKKPATSR